MDTNEIMTLAGVFVGGIFIALLGYIRKPSTAAAQDPIVASVGLEFGNRMQMDDLIKEVARIGDILEGKKQAGIEADLKEILERLDAHEEREGRRR